MKTLPDSSGFKIVNDVLKPYFKDVEREIKKLKPHLQSREFERYRMYLEQEAYNAKPSVRMQIRINLQVLKTALCLEARHEITVRPKLKFRACFPDGNFYEVTEADFGMGIHI